MIETFIQEYNLISEGCRECRSKSKGVQIRTNVETTSMESTNNQTHGKMTRIEMDGLNSIAAMRRSFPDFRI